MAFCAGFGVRGCIVSPSNYFCGAVDSYVIKGRPFAWQEITLAMASIVQKFDLSLVDPSYNLELQQALTIKPKGMQIRAALRQRANKISAVPSSPLKLEGSHSQTVTLPPVRPEASVPLYVLYGSNTGTSESFAQRIATDAPNYGQSNSIKTCLIILTLHCGRFSFSSRDPRFGHRSFALGRTCHHSHSFIRR